MACLKEYRLLRTILRHCKTLGLLSFPPICYRPRLTELARGHFWENSLMLLLMNHNKYLNYNTSCIFLTHNHLKWFILLLCCIFIVVTNMTCISHNNTYRWQTKKERRNHHLCHGICITLAKFIKNKSGSICDMMTMSARDYTAVLECVCMDVHTHVPVMLFLALYDMVWCKSKR